MTARDGSHQVWSRSTVMTAGGKAMLTAKALTPPAAPLSPRPTPRAPDGHPRLGSLPGSDGYWAYPSVTVLQQSGANVNMDAFGLLKNVADARKVAPLQPWALAIYQNRQRRFLQDDPMYLNCKPPGGPRQFQQPYGVQFVEDRERQRIFVLIGSGNRNYRIMYLDGRGAKGQVEGDDDNPLYYGRSVGKWEGDTLADHHIRIQRGFLVHQRRPCRIPSAPVDRTVHSTGSRHAEVRPDDRRRRRVHETLVHSRGPCAGSRRRTAACIFVRIIDRRP